MSKRMDKVKDAIEDHWMDALAVAIPIGVMIYSAYRFKKAWRPIPADLPEMIELASGSKLYLGEGLSKTPDDVLLLAAAYVPKTKNL